MSKHLKLVSFAYLPIYSEESTLNWQDVSTTFKMKKDFTAEDFEYYIIASSLFSSKIEGNSLDFNTFYRNRKSKSKEIQEIENLADAYKFASKNPLTEKNFLTIHATLSQTFLQKKEQGKYRKSQIGVFDSNTGRPAYMAVEPEFVKEEMKKLFGDIKILFARKLSYKETFYCASMIHIWLAKIHPFADGNGRSARLLEKWFLSEKLGELAWAINSEKYYWDNRQKYYENIALGFNYYVLFWERCTSFLQMLPEAVKNSVF